VRRGLDTSVALGVLYLIRCSLHAAALKKNVSNLMREEKTMVVAQESDDFNNETTRIGSSFHRRKYSETLDVEQNSTLHVDTKSVGKALPITEVVAAKPVSESLQEILYPYGLSQYTCALIGCFGIVPSVAATTTMYTLRADKLAPQILSIVLLSSFYLTGKWTFLQSVRTFDDIIHSHSHFYLLKTLILLDSFRKRRFLRCLS
jgi:hypothetical protein